MANDRFEYDVALSFASEDRDVAEKFADLLHIKNIAVFYDEYQPSAPAGNDFVTHIAELYRTKARYCVMLISGHYPLKKWTEEERTAARDHALRDANEYILPVRLDDTEVLGITETAGYHDLRRHSMESLTDWLEQKLRTSKTQSGPPPESHDLRSGNVPSAPDKP